MEMVKLVKELFILRWRKEVVTNNLLLQKACHPLHMRKITDFKQSNHLFFPYLFRIILIKDDIEQMIFTNHMADPSFTNQELLTDSGNIIVDNTR